MTFRPPFSQPGTDDEVANFESNAAEIAEQIAEIRLNFYNQLTLNGMGGFRSILEQLMPTDANTDNPSREWLMQLQVFN